MAYFDLEKYQTVQQRIDLFWKKYPNGRFNVSIISLTPEQVVMQASVWTDWERDEPTCVDYAEERPTSKGVNSTSHIENCSTSALGRAISQLGGELSPAGLKPSREEMAKVERISKEASSLSDADIYTKMNGLTTVESLRALYADAKANNASKELLKEIADRANGLKATQDTQG